MDKTKHLGLTKDTPYEAYSVERVNINTDKIDNFAEKTDEKLYELSRKNTEINKKIDDIDLRDVKIICTTNGNKKLNVVLSEILESINSIELTDKKIDCTEENKKLNDVLKELRLGDETVQNHIIYLNKSIDKNVKTLQEKDTNLEEAIKTLKAKDVSLEEVINETLDKTSSNSNKIQKNEEKLNVHQKHLELLDAKLSSNNTLFSEYNNRFRRLNGGE